MNENCQEISKRATLTDQISANEAASEKADQSCGNCHSCARTILGIKFSLQSSSQVLSLVAILLYKNVCDCNLLHSACRKMKMDVAASHNTVSLQSQQLGMAPTNSLEAVAGKSLAPDPRECKLC